MSNKMIAVDLDGTLLDPTSTVTDRTANALRAAQTAGWTVVVATGRPPHLVTILGDGLSTIRYCVAINGALVADMHSDSTLHSLTFPAATARSVIERLREVDPGLGFALATEDGFAHEVGFSDRLPVGNDSPVSPNAAALTGEMAMKLFTFHRERSVNEVLEYLPGTLAEIGFADLDCTHLGADAAEIGPAGIDKSVGLQWLCDHLDIRSENVVAFGDERNDLAMIEWAGVGIAMANAAADVRAVADHVAPAHDVDGVARCLEAIVDGQFSPI